MKRIFTILSLVAITTTMSFAQISDRENNESTYLVGARPEAGNFGFYFAYSSSDLYDIADTAWRASGIPLISMKYYWTDKLVFKVGAQVNKKRRSLEGELDTNAYFSIYDGITRQVSEYKHVETEAHWGISLGLEKHFDVSNLIDGYVGAQGNLGYARQVKTHNESYYPADGQTIGTQFWREGSAFGITYGLDVHIGSNMFIADLPLALGFEFGWVARNYGANKFKYQWDETIVNNAGLAVSNSGTYYTSMVADFENAQTNSLSANEIPFTDLKVRRFDIMPIARVSFTYYLRQ